MVVFPVPPFWDRTAIASDIGRTIWPAPRSRRRLTRRAPPPALYCASAFVPVARPLEEGAETGRSDCSALPVVNRRWPMSSDASRPRGPTGRASRRPASRTATPARSTPPCARTRRPAAPRWSWRSPTSRRCSTAPGTSTARATAAASWSTSPAGSGPRRFAPAATTRRWRSTPRSRSPTCSSSAPPTSSGLATTPARSSAAAASASSPSASAWSTPRRSGPPPARRSPTSGRSPGCCRTRSGASDSPST